MTRKENFKDNRLIDLMICPQHMLYGPLSPFAWHDGNLVNQLSSDPWPSNNLALYYPINLPGDFLTGYLWTMNGSAAAGNIDVGVFDARTGAKMFSSGSTAMAGTTVVQKITLAKPKLLKSGAYYLGLSCSTTGAAFYDNLVWATNLNALMTFYEQASALPLPTTMSKATVSTRNRIICFGLGRQL